MTVLCLWLWLRGGRERLVVARLWVFFFFFPMVGGCQLRSGGRGRLLGARLCARACVCVFFPLYHGFWLWLVACGAMIVVAIAIVL